MRARIVLGLVVSIAVSAALAAQTTPVAMPSADMKWMDLDPKGAPGVKIADLWGDHTKGAFGAIVKFPAGFAAPLHTHTNAYKIVVLSGTFIQGPEGKPEFRLGPGSYLYQPGDGYKHTTACDKASECTFLIDSPGMFDLKPVEAAKAPAKK
ncbi:MAG TPA: DUF4437 domain-containing protein [Thermoanaerobaculia bacterium]|nr:DUF4437 domain-containing protein [Thermoanaerobaculia bacterium]